MKLRYWLSIPLLLIFINFSYSQCSITESLDIIDLTPLSANLLIEGAINEDLSGDQSVAGILLEFEHSQIGDLTIELTSPAGQSIVLVGPTGSFGNTSLTDWEVLFVPCAGAVNPDPGFSSVWSNNQEWGNLGEYTGSYHPFSGCLENFDSGSINGNWNFQILDNTLFDEGRLLNATIFFSDPEGINCDLCTADAGEFEIDELFVCSNDNSNIDVTPSFPNGAPGFENEFMYIIRQNDAILEISSILNFSGFAEGEYQVCGISVKSSDVSTLQNLSSQGYSSLINEIQSQTPSICAAVNTNCITTTLSQNNIEVDLDVTICQGSTFPLGGEVFDQAGEYTVNVPQSSGCDSIYNLNLSTSNIESEISASSTMLDCSDPNITLSSNNSVMNGNSTITWSSIGGSINGNNTANSIIINEAGTYILTINDGLCEQSSSIEIFANSNAAEVEIMGGTITCSEPSVDLELDSDLPTSSVSWEGPNNFSSSQTDINVDVPGIYSATVVANNGCITVKSIIVNQAGSIPELSLSANELSCGNPLVTIQVSSSNNSLSYEWTGPNGFTFDGKNPIVGEPGIYEVVATDDFGCSDVFQIEIFGNPSEFEYSVISEDILCNQSVFLEVVIDDPDAITQWTLPNGSTSNNKVLTVNNPGTFDLVLTSAGCTIEESFDIEEVIEDLPQIEVVQDQIIGCTDGEATLSYNVVGDDSLIDSVFWEGPGIGINSANVNEIVAGFSGTYTLTVFTPSGCSEVYNHILLYEDNNPDIGFERQKISCVIDEGFISAIASEQLDYEWTASNGTVTVDSFVTSTIAQTYELIVSNDLGCVKKYETSILVDTIANTSGINVSNQLDCSNQEVSISVVIPRFSSFTWSDSNGLILSNDDSLFVTFPGVYYVDLIDKSSECERIDSILVTQDLSEPIVEIEDQSFNCVTETLLIDIESPTNGVKYSWSGPNGFTSNQKSPLIDDVGQYTVIVTGQNGCITEETITVDQDDELPNVSATFSNDLDCVNTQSIATGSTTTMDASFQWIGPINVFDQSEITVEIPGIYTYIVTGLNGCTDSIALNIPFTGEVPEFSAINDTLECGETELFIDVAEVTANVTYEWTGPNGYTSSNAQNVVTDEGLYIVVGTGENNCTFSDTAYIGINNEEPVIEINENLDTLDCNNTILNYSFTSDVALESIEWTGPNSFSVMDSSADIQEGGVYTLTVIGENDCESTLDFEIFEDFDEPEVELENEDINCDNQKADIFLTIDDPGATFSWEGPSFNSDLQNVVVENEGEYFVTITGSNGCTTIESVDVEEDLAMPNLVVVDDTLSCLDEPILLTATSTTDDVIIEWLGPNGFDSTGVSVLTDMEGEYFVTAIGPNGCSTQVELEVFNTPVYPDVSLNFLNNISCLDSTTTVNAEVSGDIQSILWSNNDSFSTDEESFITELGGTFVFTATGNNGCITVDSVEILIDTLYPNVVVNQIGRILCDVNTVNITGEGSDVGPGISYEWKTDDGIISFGENTLNPLIQGEGTYVLAIKNESNGCINTETLVVEREESTLESMDLDFKIQTCNDIEDGEILVAGVSGGIAPFRYALEGTSFTENSLFEGLNAGDYIVSVKDSFGCVVDSLVVLQEKNQIDVSLGDDVDVLLGEEVSVTADINISLNDVASILWEPASVIDCNFCTDFNFVPGKNMVVSVFVIDEDGCTDEDQMIIRVDDEIKLYVPNVFTPNDDGINDNFTIPISPNVAMVNSFRIYDRWGSRVFQDENFVPGSGASWNGRHLNRSVVGGVYLYVAEVEMINGDIRIIRGDITVMK